jgi:spermidine synthase
MSSPEFDVIDAVTTPIGNIYLSRRELLQQPSAPVYEVQIDGHLLMSSLNPVSERQLSTRALALHQGAGELRALVGGLGLGYTAQAALASPRVASVRVVDKMDFVIRWMRSGMLPLSAELTDSPRVQLLQGDVYADLLGPGTETFDLILIDVDHAPDWLLDPSSAPFYTVAGQRTVSKRLAPGGILGVWSANESQAFLQVMQEVYPGAIEEHVTWENVEQGSNPEPFHNVLYFGRKAD